MIDAQLVRSLSATPIDPNVWRAMVGEHRRFLDGKQSHYGTWELLSAAGLPLALWKGPKSATGTQINLSFGNLQGLDLTWAVLPCAAMPGVNATGQSLRGAVLSRSLLTDSQLDDTDFSLAKLEYVDFSRSSLRNACFRKALLMKADFENCDLTGADFRGAKLEGAKFPGAILDGVLGEIPG